MNDVVTPKPKKSVALSGVVAGNTALCTVGRTGNDLNYRGYDILEIARDVCECSKRSRTCSSTASCRTIAGAHLAYKASSCKAAARRCGACGEAPRWSSFRPPTHAMDVMRTGVSALELLRCRRRTDHNVPGARNGIADRLMASLGSMLLYWYHFSHNGRRIEVETDDESIGGHFLHLLHGRTPAASWVRAMHTSLNLYAEHEFNASTFTARVIAGTGADIHSAITGAIGALREARSLTAAPTRSRSTSKSGYETPDEAEADIRRRVAGKEVVIDFRPFPSTRSPIRATRSSKDVAAPAVVGRSVRSTARCSGSPSVSRR